MKIGKTLPIIFLTLAVLGFLDATYLTVEHYLGAVPPCLITDGCSSVLTSPWSIVLGVPVALIGAFYYLVILIMAVAYLRTERGKFFLVASFATVVGLLAAVWFVILQVFIIKSICFYCMFSATMSTGLFIVGASVLVKFRAKLKSAPPAHGNGNDMVKKIGE